MLLQVWWMFAILRSRLFFFFLSDLNGGRVVAHFVNSLFPGVEFPNHVTQSFKM